MSDERPLIALLTLPTSAPGSLYGLYDVLLTVGVFYEDITLGQPGAEALDVRLVSLDGRPFHCVGGVPVEPHCALADLPQPDALVVCDVYCPIHRAPRGEYDEVGARLRELHAGGALIASICTGSLVLAESGLLDGRDAASHWAFGDLFADAYPQIRLRRNATLCLSEEADRIVTAGGATSWHELALYLISRFCGARRAQETAMAHLLSGHADGQLPYASINRRVNTSDEVIARCQEWIASSYADPNPVQRMAARTGMNLRTFTRRFRAATGRGALDYVQALRVEEAKQMLETGPEPVGDVAAAVGYQDPASFRRLFQRLVGTTPATYRRRYAIRAA